MIVLNVIQMVALTIYDMELIHALPLVWMEHMQIVQLTNVFNVIKIV